MAAMREIVDISHRIAYILGSQLQILIVGLDLALDKAGHIWLIEANLSPQCKKCKLVNDRVSVEKYMRAREIIRSSRQE